MAALFCVPPLFFRVCLLCPSCVLPVSFLCSSCVLPGVPLGVSFLVSLLVSLLVSFLWSSWVLPGLFALLSCVFPVSFRYPSGWSSCGVVLVFLRLSSCLLRRVSCVLPGPFRRLRSVAFLFRAYSFRWQKMGDFFLPMSFRVLSLGVFPGVFRRACRCRSCVFTSAPFRRLSCRLHFGAAPAPFRCPSGAFT